MRPPRWLEWAREIQALAQTDSHYPTDEYHKQQNLRLTEIAAEMVSEYSNLEYPLVLETFGKQIGYATPRIDVRGAVFQEHRLQLVKERTDGRWTMPDGWADVGDVPSQAAEREVWEEAGFHVKASKVVGVYDANRRGKVELFHSFKIVFLCDLLSGLATPSIETCDAAFFGRGEVPAELSSERTHVRHIQDAFACIENPGCPTVFD